MVGSIQICFPFLLNLISLNFLSSNKIKLFLKEKILNSIKYLTVIYFYNIGENYRRFILKCHF